MTSRGQSLVQVLISIAIMSIGMVVFAGMIESQHRELAQLSQKLAATDLEKLLLASLADGTVCQYVMNKPTQLTFDSTKLPATIPLTAPATLYTNILSTTPPTPGLVAAQAGKQASPLSATLTVKSINFVVTAGAAGNYSGAFVVDFDPSSLIRPIVPAQISQTLLVDDSKPKSATITNCQTSTAPTMIAPIGAVVAWYSSMPGTPALPPGWVPCDGAVLHDSLSVYDGKAVPNLNTGVEASTGFGYFLRGYKKSGIPEGQATAKNGLTITHAGYKLAAPFSWLGYYSGGWGGAQYGGAWTGSIGSSDAETHPPSMTVVWIMRVH